eukprot:7144238-Pyramimonas_sp.AAC.1
MARSFFRPEPPPVLLDRIQVRAARRGVPEDDLGPLVCSLADGAREEMLAVAQRVPWAPLIDGAESLDRPRQQPLVHGRRPLVDRALLVVEKKGGRRAAGADAAPRGQRPGQRQLLAHSSCPASSGASAMQGP